MKRIDYSKIINDTEWVRIDYYSASSHGTYIMKKSLSDMKIKRIEKLLKSTECKIINNYHITMYDIIESAIRRLNDIYLNAKYIIEREYTRTWRDYDYIREYETIRDDAKMKIERLGRMIK